MSIEKMREEFEAFILEKHPILMLLQDPKGGYIDGRTDAYWSVWQASRAAIEIELPKIIDKEWANTHAERCAIRDAIGICKKRIEAAGIPTK